MTERQRPPLPGAGVVGLEASVESRLFAGHLLTVWGIGVSNGLLGLAVLLVWIRRGLPLGAPALWSRRARRYLLPIGIYQLLIGVSVLLSYDPRKSLPELGEVFALAVLPMSILLIRGDRAVRRMVSWLLVMMVGLALHGLWQYLFSDQGPIDNRIRGLFSHYMTFSGVLVLGLAMALSRLVTAGRWRLARYWVAGGIIAATVFLTLTRHAWLSSLLLLTLAVWIGARRWLIPYLGALVLAVALVAAVAPGPWSRIRSVVDVENPSNFGRICMVYAGAEMLAERPLFGIGPRLIADWYPIYRHPAARHERVAHLHDTFINLAAEYGLLTLAAYLWLMIAVLVAAVGGYRAEGGRAGPRADLYLLVVFAIVSLNFSGLFEANWRDSEIQRLILFILAIPCCMEASADASANEVSARTEAGG